jgi:uncharacterized protein (TIGR00730 family)
MTHDAPDASDSAPDLTADLAAGRRPCLVVFGGGACEPGDAAWEAAAQVGAAFARAGWTLANGGYGGTMLASAQAARQAGGVTIGVACSIFSSQPNPFLTEVAWTDNQHDRLRRLIELGDAYLCLPGSTGTLAEMAMTWEMMNKRLLPTRPLMCWGDFWRPVVEVFRQDPNQDPRVPALAGLRERRGDLVTFVNSAPQALAAAAR